MGVFVAAAFNVAVCFGIPIGALVLYLVRDKLRAAAFGLGVLSFLVSQVILRSALLGVLNGMPGFAVFAAVNPLLYTLFLAATAALFEEPARYVFLRTQRKRAFDVRIAVAFGLGHGGLEAMLIGANSAFLLLAPAHLMLADASIGLAGVERISTLMIHVSLSVLVYAAVMRHDARPFVCALGLHTAVDSLTFLPIYLGMPGWIFEALLLMISSAMLVLTLRWAKSQPKRMADSVPSATGPATEAPAPVTRKDQQ